jgi:hypothetical protein
MADPNSDPPQAATELRRGRSVFRPGHDPAVREESLRLVRAALQKAGFEADRVEDLKRRNDSDLREALAKSRAAADERAPAMRDAVSRSSETWLRAHGVGDAVAPAGVYYLSTADRISATPGLQLLSENLAPWANRAEVILDRRAGNSGDSFAGQVTFSFSWENPTGQANMFNVTALLGVTASCIVTADGYWFPLDWTMPASRLDAHAGLRITELEDGHVVEPPFQSDQRAQILYGLYVFGSWGEGEIAGQDVFRTYVLQHLGLSVPANGRVDLDLSCGVNWLGYNGGGFFIAAGGGRQVTGWGVIITAA